MDTQTYNNLQSGNYAKLVQQNKELQEELQKFKNANTQKNEFLQKLGINGTGEFKRIKIYINELEIKNKQLREELQLKDEMLMCCIKEMIYISPDDKKVKIAKRFLKNLAKNNIERKCKYNIDVNKAKELLNE